MKIPFNEKEMEVVAQMPAFGGGTIPVFNYQHHGAGKAHLLRQGSPVDSERL